MVTPWSEWCRLCSKDNVCGVDVLSNNENENNWKLQKTIGKYFTISMHENDGTPSRICKNCFKFIENLEIFADRVLKVETMFSELLQGKIPIDEQDIESIRKQYGIQHFEKCDQSTDTNDLNTDECIPMKEKKSEANPVVKSEPTDDNVYENYVAIEENDDSNEVPQDPVCVIIKTENDDEEEEAMEQKKPTTRRSASTRKRKLRLKEVEYEEEESLETKDKVKYYEGSDNDYDNDSGDFDDEDYEETKKKKSKRKKRQTKSVGGGSDGSGTAGTSTGEKSQTRRKREKKTDDDKEKAQIKCELCDKVFSRKSSCRYHMESVHALPQELNYECSNCGKKFSTEKRLKSHAITHLPPDEKMMYPCPYCDKKFTKQVNVNPHIRAVHIGEKSFICEECGKTFVTKGALKEHMYTHIEETPFACSKCPKKFKNSARLKVHEDIHNDIKFICPHCGLQLNTRRTLYTHMVIHSDEKKYKCKLCGNEYKRSKTLKNHMVLHTGLRPYICQFCDKTFKYGSSCRYHKKKAHPDELAALEMAGETITPTLNIPR